MHPNLFRLSQEYASDATGKANEVLSNFRTVRAFANEKLEEASFKELIDKSCYKNQVRYYLVSHV